VKRKNKKSHLLADWLLKKLLSEEEYLEKSGDIDEVYNSIIEEKGIFRARLWHFGQVIGTLPISILHSIRWSLTMFGNYMKMTLRMLKKNKLYSLITISGFTIGITCCILILLFVQYELSYDKYHENAGDIYRIHSEVTGLVREGSTKSTTSPGLLAPALVSDFPEVIMAARMRRSESTTTYKSKVFYEKDIFHVDREFLKIFTFPLVSGNQETALSDSYSVLLTEKTAEKYFGDENPLGKTILLDNRFSYKITGILENPPKNSHFQFDFLASIKTLPDIEGEDIFNWGSTNYIRTYIQLQRGSNPAHLEEKLPDFVKKHHGEDSRWKFYLQPLTGIHLHSSVRQEIEANGDIKYIYIFTTAAFLLILVACFNYMNLSTAYSAKRLKEIGLRKVVGADRKQIIAQFIGESMIFTLGAVVLSLFLAELLLPSFNVLVDRDMNFNMLSSGGTLSGLLFLTVLVGFISGSYPAFYLSTFQPVHIVKGRLNLRNKSVFRNTIVLFQFAISVILIISAFIVYKQLAFIQNQSLGFTKENIMVVTVQDQTLKNNIEPLKNELAGSPEILGTSLSTHLPHQISAHTGGIRWEGISSEEITSFYEAWIDNDFLDFYGIEFAEGRNFSKEFPSDIQNGYIVNEKAVETFGLDNPIGKRFGYEPMGSIIGVVKDFHHWSFHKDIEPIVLMHIGNRTYPEYFLSIKFISKNLNKTVASIENTFKKHSSGYPFTYSFLDEGINRMYDNEIKLRRIFNYFSIIAIILASLGLFGLVTFTAERRTKEIGIRKVLGATVSSVVFQLSKDFIKWVLIANLVAWPVAYFTMNRWLQGFAYKINIGFAVFVFAALLAFLIAFVTISFQAIRAALANPVDSLKYE